jgi:RecG-like helicase
MNLAANKIGVDLDSYNPPVTRLKGIGPHLAEQFVASGIARLSDLLGWLPEAYFDPAQLIFLERWQPQAKTQALNSSKVHLVGRLTHAGVSHATRSGTDWFEVHLGEAHRLRLKGIWSPYDLLVMQHSIKLGDWVILSGTPQFNPNSPTPTVPQMQNPLLVPLGKDYPRWPIHKFSTLHYTMVPGISPLKLRKIIQTQVAHQSQRMDFLVDQAAFEKAALPLPSRALHQLHLDWPCEQLSLLQQKNSPAHQSIRLLQTILTG